MKAKKIISRILIVSLCLIIVGLSILLIYINNSLKTVRGMNVTLTNNEQNYSKIYDYNGNELKSTEKLENNYVYLDQIPEHTKQAFISIEDKDFYKHNGLNYKRIVKASYNNLKSKNLSEGASTITQQLVKNRFLTNEKTFDRKIKEAYLSKKLEKNETKDKILETYLNTIYFGAGAYGIGNASMTYFNKKPIDLSLSESCVLAGIIKSPAKYSPLTNLDNAISRRNLVLNEMLKDGKISEEEFDNSCKEEINISDISTINTLSELDLYSQFALKEASNILGTNVFNVLHGGYKIYTYQDNDIQNNLNDKINNDIYYHKNSKGNIADSLSIITDNKSHGVSAISGRSKYVLTDIKRQPGSLIKPILTYAPAIEKGLVNAKTQILDEEINLAGYSPKNLGNIYHGFVSVEDAVAQSLNIPAVKLTQELGLETCKNYAKKCGINFNEEYDNNYAISLGGFTDGVTLQEITDAYSVFTNNGNYQKSSFVQKICDSKNNTIYNRKLSETNVYGTDTAYLMTNILNYSVKNGTSKNLSKLPFYVAGKTGTVAVKNTNLNTDVYSLAYTTDHTMSVWLGNYTMDKEYHLEGKNNGGTFATKIIRDCMLQLYENNPPEDFVIPDTVTDIIIDSKTLNDEHIITIGTNIPERYQEHCLVSTRYIPTEISTKFETIDEFDFDIEKFKNSCKISFNSEDFLTYTIYRKSFGDYKPIKVISGNDEKIEFIDTNMEKNVNYTYYIRATNNYSTSEFNTTKKSVKLEKGYLELIKNNNESNSYAWLFG